MPHVVLAVGGRFHPIERYVREKYPNVALNSPERTRLALALVLKYHQTLKYICETDDDDQHSYLVPNRMKKYFSIVHLQYGPRGAINHNAYKVDEIAKYYAEGRAPSREEFDAIYNYANWWTFDDTDEEEIAAAREMFPQLPSPREWQSVCWGKSSINTDWDRFAAACYEIMEFDQVRELQLADDIRRGKSR